MSEPDGQPDGQDETAGDAEAQEQLAVLSQATREPSEAFGDLLRGGRYVGR